MKKTILFALAIVISTHLQAQKTYENIEDFGIYKTNWALVKLNGKYGFITKKGKEVVKPQYDKIFDFGTYMSDWALVMVVIDGKEKYGFINKKGSEVVQPKYDNIYDFGAKLFGCAEVAINGGFTFINKKGKQITGN